MKVDRQLGVGFVEQVASILKREIAAGRYATGEHLPSALALGKLVGASEKPVRGALRQLAAEGWVRPVRGVWSVKCWERLKRMGVQCELHTLAKRSHVFSRRASPGTGSYTYLERIWDFVNRQCAGNKMSKDQ